MENYYYLYETVNFTKMKYYIGQHCTHDMNDGYLGSCKELKEDINNGDEYEVNIIAHFNNIYDLGWAEWLEIKERNCTKDSDYYNKYNGIFFNENFENGLSKITKNKMSKIKKGRVSTFKGKHLSETSKLKISNTLTGRIQSEETKLKRRITKSTLPGRKQTESTKIKISNSKKGCEPWNKGIKKKNSFVNI